MRYRILRCRLSELCDAKGLTKRDLERITGIRETNLSAYASNRRLMTLKTAKTISVALGCSIDDLYEWREDNAD